MPETLTINFNLNVTVDGKVRLDHHHYHSSNPSQPGAADILNAIRDSKETIMTQLDTSTAKETGDFQTLLAAVNGLEDAFAALKGQNNTALQAALDAANLDSATQAAILDANDQAIEAAIGKVNALLNSPAPATPPTPPATPAAGADTTGGTVGNDTSAGAGGGTDTTGGTTSGSAGDDSVQAGGGSDAVSALTVTSNSTGLPDAVTGQPYTGRLSISGGKAPYSVQPSTPTVNGLTMDSAGNVTGTSTADGVVSFSGTVADSATPNQQQPFSVSFNSSPAVQNV